MSTSLFSTSWYLVSELTPKLGSHIHIHRHCYRNTLWHVLEDRRSARQHRLSESAYFIVGRLDGERTVQQIWNLATEALGDQSPTQDEVIQLLGRLHAADVLLCDVPADTDELLRRQQDSTTKNLKRRLSNPLSMRFALCDPDRFLSRLLPLARPFISVWFACIWLVVVGSALALAITHWNTLSAEMLERVFAPYNLILMAICFPLLKGLHELGHAITTKAFGGEVHDTGICLLVLAPVPYVDASAASAFTSKRRRILVSMSGMAVELFVASLALFLWLNVQPGLVKDLAYVLMFIAGVSTVLFNANPLLKFDGYYVLSDAIEIPNLASRANRYITYLIQRYLFGVTDLDTPASAPGESTWFATYACAAFAYRVFILSVIIVFIAGKFFFLGVCLAIWAVIALICLPLAKAAKFVLASPQLTNQRSRAIGATSAILIAVTAFAFLMPLPFWTRVEGVVWLPEHSLVRSGIEGTVTRIVSVLDERVGVGQPLVITADPFLESHEKILQTNLAEAQARYRMAHSTSRVEAGNLKLEIAHIRADLDQTRADLDKQTVRSSANGTFVLSRGDD
ncbi:MAG: PqqD family peptide modification chaperone, partial [Gammaproteobacteria bacterium]|nr:PqqD family peptide modification chaperone [Gammaproteobacteria bacterium]